MADYLDLTGFKGLTLMPAADVDALEADEPGWIVKLLGAKSRWIDARLRKRYLAPFAAPVPDVVTDWLARIVTWRCLLKRGVDPTDKEVADLVEDGKTAEAEVKEAASSVDALFDLPLRQDTTATGISKGGPVVVADASPYTWMNRQRDAAQNEN